MANTTRVLLFGSQEKEISGAVNVRESDIEKHLVQRVEALGGICRKYTSNVRGVADRICFFPKGLMFLVETKAPTGKISTAQLREAKRMGELGFQTFFLHSTNEVDSFINRVEYRLSRTL